MSTANKFQESTTVLAPSAVISSVKYLPRLHGHGGAQGAWTPREYVNASIKKIKISIDEGIMQSPQSLYTNIRKQFGIGYDEYTISCRPITLELVESLWADKSAQLIFPAVYTLMNRCYDKLNAARLKEVSKAGTAYAWTCPSEFIANVSNNILMGGHDNEAPKHLIIDHVTDSALRVMNHYTEKSDTYENFMKMLNRNNTTLTVCRYLNTETTANNTGYYLINADYLMEYAGILPKYFKAGENDRDNESWVQFMFSTTDYKPLHERAVTYIQITALDPAKIGEKSCPKKD